MTLLWFLACRALPEAPVEVGELGRFLFDRFDDEDSAELEAGLTNLARRLRTEDFTLDAADRAVAMPVLRPDDLGALSLPEGTASEDQVGVAVSGVSRFALEAQRALVTDPVQTCVESRATTWAGRTFDTDPDCFFAFCDRLVTGNTVRRESLLARVWYDQPKVYRAFALEGDAIDVIVGRAHIDRIFESDGGGNAWRQLFQLDAFVRDGDRTLRWFASWTELDVLGVSDDLLANLVVSGVEEALQFGDEILGDGASSCTHDRDAPMPTRP
ncbi:MAG: hypothetical protein AAF602_13820 [Myxococcota bacterium]